MKTSEWIGVPISAAAIAAYKSHTLSWSVTDYTYGTLDLVLWTSIEANFVLIGACIPTLYPFVKKLFGKPSPGVPLPGDITTRRRPRPPGGGTVATIGRRRVRAPQHSWWRLGSSRGESSRVSEEPSSHAGTAESQPGQSLTQPQLPAPRG